MQGQAEQLSKSRKKFLATMYKLFPGTLYTRPPTYLQAHLSHLIAEFGSGRIFAFLRAGEGRGGAGRGGRKEKARIC